MPVISVQSHPLIHSNDSPMPLIKFLIWQWLCVQELCYSPELLDLVKGHIVPSEALFCSTLQRNIPLQTQLDWQTITPITIPG